MRVIFIILTSRNPFNCRLNDCSHRRKNAEGLTALPQSEEGRTNTLIYAFPQPKYILDIQGNTDILTL